MKKNAQKIAIFFLVIVIGVPLIVFLIALILIALPFLTIGFVFYKLHQTIVFVNQDNLKLKHKLNTNRDYLTYKYKLQKLKNEN